MTTKVEANAETKAEAAVYYQRVSNGSLVHDDKEYKTRDLLVFI
jgi:hypothetical protein